MKYRVVIKGHGMDFEREIDTELAWMLLRAVMRELDRQEQRPSEAPPAESES